jgi:hypothetical protein
MPTRELRFILKNACKKGLQVKQAILNDNFVDAMKEDFLIAHYKFALIKHLFHPWLYGWKACTEEEARQEAQDSWDSLMEDIKEMNV